MNGLYSFDASNNTDQFAQQYNVVEGTSLCVAVAMSEKSRSEYLAI